MPPGGLTAAMPPEGVPTDIVSQKWSYSGHAARKGSYRHHATKVVLQQSCRLKRPSRHHATKWSYCSMPPGGLTAVMPPEGGPTDIMPRKWSYSRMPRGGLTAVSRPEGVLTDIMPRKWSYSNQAARKESYRHHATKVVLQ
jgi:hypothetical protein